MGNTFGKLFRVITFGESHGEALGAVIDGCPSKIPLSEADIQAELDRRKPGQSAVTTSRKEPDRVKILSGVFEGKTLGTPIALVVFNENARSSDYENLKDIFRPGHADFAWETKFGIRDFRGGGRASGRETIGRVMAGAVAKKVLKAFSKIEIEGIAAQIGNIAGREKIKEMEAYILKMKGEGDSCGGIVEITVKNMITGLGEPVFDKLNADFSKAIFSIPAVTAVEFGAGKSAATLKGSELNKMASGISGGISTGDDILIKITVKPPSSIAKEQKAMNRSGKKVKLQITGRHDPCIIPRFIPVAESMVAITLTDHLLRYRAIKN